MYRCCRCAACTRRLVGSVQSLQLRPRRVVRSTHAHLLRRLHRAVSRHGLLLRHDLAPHATGRPAGWQLQARLSTAAGRPSTQRSRRRPTSPAAGVCSSWPAGSRACHTANSAGDTNHHEMATQDDKNSYSDDVMECQQRTVDADFPDRLLPAAVTSATTVVARMEKSNDETPQNTSTVIQWSSTISEHRHTSTCLSHNNDEEEEQTKPQTTTKHEGY